MTASSRRLPAAHILLSDSLYSIACCAFPSTRNSTLKATAPSTVAPALTPALSPASGPLAADCEHNTLRLLGWQQAYSPRGYTINTQLCSSCSTATWQALGCLKTLTNLTLTGSLPDLPDARGALQQLKALHLSQVNIAGEDVPLARLFSSHSSTLHPYRLHKHAWQPLWTTICTSHVRYNLTISTYSCQAFLKSSCKNCIKCVRAQVRYLLHGERLIAFLPCPHSNWEGLS